MYLLGYDLGSSSIKVALVEAKSGKALAVTSYPDKEMEILAEQPDWAEQSPETWWQNLKHATTRIFQNIEVDKSQIQGIGIGYQMHGLVSVDANQEVIRPAIIWCDSRATEFGDVAFRDIGEQKCLQHLLNSPGNFTASKLKWVKDNEPELYARIDKIMLPGDYIGMKMTGKIYTTVTGLSEGMFWDFKNHDLAHFLLDYYGINQSLVPEIVPALGEHGNLTKEAADFLGLPEGLPLTYRAGDQPNNAVALNTLHQGEIAATGGTSGVVYGVVNQPVIDPQTRVNSFAHVNHSRENPHIGVLLCVNGSGIQYSWLRRILGDEEVDYNIIETKAATIPIGAAGVVVLPFGNGAERLLGNRNPGGQILNLNFNLHKQAHLYRASLEGVAFAFVYGVKVMQEMGLKIKVLKVGNDNLFQSNIFSTTVATLLGCDIKMMETTGAIGAAKAAGVGAGVYNDLASALSNEQLVQLYKPSLNKDKYQQAYDRWLEALDKL